LFGAYKGYDISLRKDDKVTLIESELITTEKEFYTVPSFSSKDTLNVRVGTELDLGDSLFDVCTIVNDTGYPAWFSNKKLIADLSVLGTAGVSDLETKLRKLISDNSRLIWGSDLPIRISITDEESLGLWLSAPVLNMPVVKFSLGKDPVTNKTSGSNMVMYSTLDRPVAYSITASYNHSTEKVTLNLGIIIEDLDIDSGGVFVSATGISGRILDPDVTGTWVGTISQDRKPIVLETAESLALTFDVSGCTFNEGFSPDIGDWVWFEESGSGFWTKAKVNRVTQRSALQVPEKLECLWYGRTLPATGTYNDAVIFQSYNGDPFTGVDDARIDAFGKLLELVSRHIEIVIVDGEIITASEAETCLAEYKDYIDIWKAFIVLEAADSEAFMAIKEKLHGYSQT